MKDRQVLLIVKNDSDQFHIDGMMTTEQRDRLQEICLGDEAIAADFTVAGLEVLFKCPNGSLIKIHLP